MSNPTSTNTERVADSVRASYDPATARIAIELRDSTRRMVAIAASGIRSSIAYARDLTVALDVRPVGTDFRVVAHDGSVWRVSHALTRDLRDALLEASLAAQADVRALLQTMESEIDALGAAVNAERKGVRS